MLRLLLLLILSATSLAVVSWVGRAPSDVGEVRAAEREGGGRPRRAAELAAPGEHEGGRVGPAIVPGAPSFEAFEEREAGEVGDELLLELLGQLRSDEVRWNATGASSTLHDLSLEGEVRRRIAALAAPLLRSDDDQQRIMVTALCMDVATREARAGRLARPQPEVTAAALRWLGGPATYHEDRLDFEVYHCPSQRLARRFCEAHEPHLRAALRDLLLRPAAAEGARDEARFEAAWILTLAGAPWTEDLAAVLVDHLADNDISEDAVRSMYALKRLGPGALPALEHALATSTDPQQRLAAELLISEIHVPGSSRSVDRKAQRIFRSAVPFPAADWSTRFMW